MGPNKSIAYLLADLGYDVWMGNARGNRYSRNHIKLSPVSAEFWNFSFHEIAVYDLPAIIDFILMMTEQDQLYYIGHSQDSTNFFVLNSMRPEYNSRIRASIHFSPVVYLQHMFSPLLRVFAIFTNILGIIGDVIGVGEFLPNTKFISSLGSSFCKSGDVTQVICSSIPFLTFGYNYQNMPENLLPLIMAHLPAGSSSKQFIHCGQLVNSGAFRQFDYGILENMFQYNNAMPPSYYIKNVTVPVICFKAQNDVLAHPKDVERMHNAISNAIAIDLPDPNFAHFDYMFGLNAKEMVYDKVFEILKHN